MEISLPSTATSGRCCDFSESAIGSERSSDEELSEVHVSLSPRHVLPQEEKVDHSHHRCRDTDVVSTKRIGEKEQITSSSTGAIFWEAKTMYMYLKSTMTNQGLRTEKVGRQFQGVKCQEDSGAHTKQTSGWLGKLRKKRQQQLRITPLVLQVEGGPPWKTVVLELKATLCADNQTTNLTNKAKGRENLENILSVTEAVETFTTELKIRLKPLPHSRFQFATCKKLSTEDSVSDPKVEVHRTQLELKITRIPATSGNQIQQLHFSTSFATAEGKRKRKRFVFSTENTDEGRKQEKPELKKPKPQESDEWDIIEAADNRCCVDQPPEDPEHELPPSTTTSSSTTPCRPTVVTFSPFTFAPRIANNFPVSKSPVVATPVPVFAPEKSMEVCQRLVQKNHPRLKLGSRMLQKPRASLGRVGIDSYDFARARHNLANHSLLLSSLLHVLSPKNALYFAGVGRKKFFKDPYTITLGGFSKVTNFLRDAVMTPAANRPIDEYAELMSDLPSIFSVNSQAEQSYEMVVTESPLGPRPDVERRSPLTEAEWASHLDKEGRVTDVAELQRKIFRGGLVPSLRREVWKFLLKYYPWNSTSKERTALRKLKEDEYFCMKAQWKTVTPQQEKRFSKHRDNKCIIGMSITEKDVIRTDRTHPFFVGEHNPHIEVLHDILMTYCQYNMDLGYVQGMSDLLAPILVVMEREVDAFWCLVGFLDDHGLVMNFDMEQEGMRNQLMQLNNMMQIVDPKLYSYLQSKECSNLYFCFRWLLIWFKREFTMDNISRVWEIMWTGLPCKNFHFLMCLAILDGERDLLEKENFDFSDILKHVNELSCSIDADKILQTAEAIYLQLVDYPELPETIREVIGLSSEENGLTENGSHASESSIEVLADPSE